MKCGHVHYSSEVAVDSLLSSVSMPRQRVMEVREGREREGEFSRDTSSGTQSSEHSREQLEAEGGQSLLMYSGTSLIRTHLSVLISEVS